MASGNVSNNPLNVVAEFYWSTFNGNAVENANYVQTQLQLESALPLLPTLQSQLAPLKPYLTNNLGTLFNTAWATVQTAEQDAAATIFTTEANNGGASINSVTCTLAPAGILIAETIDAESRRTSQLILIVSTFRGQFSFRTWECDRVVQARFRCRHRYLNASARLTVQPSPNERGSVIQRVPAPRQPRGRRWYFPG